MGQQAYGESLSESNNLETNMVICRDSTKVCVLDEMEKKKLALRRKESLF
jgi:hypothetical protein